MKVMLINDNRLISITYMIEKLQDGIISYGLFSKE